MKEKTNFHLNRRKFVKSSALVTGGLVVNALPVDASAYVQGDDVIKVALVGCGGRGTGAASQAMMAKDNVRIVAMADAFRDRLDRCHDTLTKKHGESGQLTVNEEHKFVGFDAYKNAIDLARSGSGKLIFTNDASINIPKEQLYTFLRDLR